MSQVKTVRTPKTIEEQIAEAASTALYYHNEALYALHEEGDEKLANEYWEKAHRAALRQAALMYR